MTSLSEHIAAIQLDEVDGLIERLRRDQERARKAHQSFDPLVTLTSRRLEIEMETQC